jgi:hypothetical protein
MIVAVVAVMERWPAFEVIVVVVVGVLSGEDEDDGEVDV